jgi:glycerophosphoryl diester phosphodiesterase
LLPRVDRVTASLVAKAHHNDLRVVPWTANEPRQMRALLAMGVDGIITNYPNRLIDVLALSEREN